MHAGFYGTSESQTFSEASSSGRDYLAEVCREWEAEAQKANTKRTVILRSGEISFTLHSPFYYPGLAAVLSLQTQQM